MTHAIGPLFLLSGVAVVVAAWWYGRGNTTPPAPAPGGPPGQLESFSAHPAANLAPSRDGWVAAVEVHISTHRTEVLRGELVHPTMTGALDEARAMAATRRRELAA